MKLCTMPEYAVKNFSLIKLKIQNQFDCDSWTLSKIFIWMLQHQLTCNVIYQSLPNDLEHCIFYQNKVVNGCHFLWCTCYRLIVEDKLAVNFFEQNDVIFQNKCSLMLIYIIIIWDNFSSYISKLILLSVKVKSIKSGYSI